MKKAVDTKKMVLLAVLLAMEIVMSRFLSVSLWNMKFGFAFVAVMLAGYIAGPVGGAIVGGLGDLIGAIAFPIGAYFPGFTFTAALNGIVYGFFMNNKRERIGLVRVLIAVISTQLVCSLLLNTLWIAILYGSPFFGQLIARLPQIAIMSIIQILFALFALDRVKLLKKC